MNMTTNSSAGKSGNFKLNRRARRLSLQRGRNRQACCFAHRDHANPVHLPCAVTPAGLYDYKKGGQLILHEPKLIIELRPGQTMLLLSACITHENVPVADNEY